MTSMPQNRSTVDDLALLIGRDEATEVRKELMMMKHRLGPDLAVRVAQHLSGLPPEAIRHLIYDPNLEANCIAEDDMVNEALGTFTTPPIVTPMQDQTISSSSQSVIPGIKSRHARVASLACSKSDVARPSEPEKLSMRCKRMDCAHHAPFKSLRGLREHFVLKHDVSIEQARKEAESAFKLWNGTLSQSQYLEPPGGLFASARTRVPSDEGKFSDEAYSMGPPLSPVSAGNQAPFHMPTSFNSAGGQFKRIPSNSQQFALEEYRNSSRPDLQASTTPSPCPDIVSSETMAVDMPASIWPNYHNQWNGDLLQCPGQQYPCTPSIELQPDIDAPQYSSLHESHHSPPGWK
ncbi:hypothetical protein BDV97DRAFT_372388 [Delphinella strobiligena]|nr:hypothetical protein BDV97DRAFT_372388 [Delphinella strobiligena]